MIIQSFDNGFINNIKAQSIGPENKDFVMIKNLRIYVDLAITPQEQSKGLSVKNSLKENEGMLFVFDIPSKHSFWMKDMKFPIDIIWISQQNKIVHIERNLQPCILFLLCKSYIPNSEALYVLEVVANFTDKNNINIGDTVYLNVSKSAI
ncbi:MAG: DUF192 domain-containing protein [Thermoproteota archaeon]|nr:DUF192 domain-containing protein [Thermoproteota archaeon]